MRRDRPHSLERVRFRGEVVSDMTDRGKTRWPGTPVKHRAKMPWIKMYDKAGSVLRVETVNNQPDAFKVRKRVQRKGKRVTEWVPMRKGVANLFRYREVSLAANGCYLEALAAVDDPSAALKQLDTLTQRKRTRSGQSVTSSRGSLWSGNRSSPCSISACTGTTTRPGAAGCRSCWSPCAGRWRC